jgi:hypothetical protein
MLALNLVNRSFIDLLKPLSFNQGAPLGFLLAQKVVISILGSKDYILRLIPLTAGLVSILLMYLVSKKIGRHLSIILSLGLVALSQNLIYYSSELKQYSTDVLATLVLLLFCLKCLETKVKLTSIVVLGIVSSLTIWFSHPSVFICAGIFLTLGLDFALNGDTNRLFWLLGVGVVWGICIGFIYIINLRYLASNNFLLNFWNGGFAPLPPWSNIGWYKISMINMLKDPATLPANLITVGLLIIGIFSFSLRRWQLMMILLAPFLFLLITSALGKYPFSFLFHSYYCYSQKELKELGWC